MANGIANNEKKEKKPISKKPANQSEKSNVCVSRFTKTPTKGFVEFKGVSVGDRHKKQIRENENVVVKVTDTPIVVTENMKLHIENGSSVNVSKVDSRGDRE